ncbi:MAG: GFA family protein [Pseudomonadota bacterium]|nr:GFA family protein [Pseudomonadota bacterium]
MAIQGSCLCNAVTFMVADNFDHFFICHCEYCQKDSGSAFAANLFINADAVTWLTGKENIRHFQLPSTRHARSFCATCGSALPYVMADNLTAVVPAGSLNSPPTKQPDAHIFTASQCLWESSLASIRSFKQFPGE